MLSDREREFRLRPRKPPAAKRGNEIGAWSVLYKAVMRHARMTRKAEFVDSRFEQRLPVVANECARKVGAYRQVEEPVERPDSLCHI